MAYKIQKTGVGKLFEISRSAGRATRAPILRKLSFLAPVEEKGHIRDAECM